MYCDCVPWYQQPHLPENYRHTVFFPRSVVVACLSSATSSSPHHHLLSICLSIYSPIRIYVQAQNMFVAAHNSLCRYRWWSAHSIATSLQNDTLSRTFAHIHNIQNTQHSTHHDNNNGRLGVFHSNCNWVTRLPLLVCWAHSTSARWSLLLPSRAIPQVQ